MVGAFIQLVGTLFFNANTIDAMFETFTVEETNRLVWGPDFLGCIAFLVASHLFLVSGCGRLWWTNTDDPVWWAALLNYIGSIFFMASALASFTLETTGETINIAIVNSGTFVGAVCFVVGSPQVSLSKARQTRNRVGRYASAMEIARRHTAVDVLDPLKRSRECFHAERQAEHPHSVGRRHRRRVHHRSERVSDRYVEGRVAGCDCWDCQFVSDRVLTSWRARLGWVVASIKDDWRTVLADS